LAAVLLAAGAAGAQPPQPPEPSWRVLRGACYCRAAGELMCTAGLTEPDCRRRCVEAFCDEWFWLERLPCWNWGYGG
jgi:hypothetical protein